MSVEELKREVANFENEIRTLKNRSTKVTNENKTYDLRIKEN